MSIKQYKLWRDKETLEYLYWEKEMSHQDIADRVGCSDTTVSKWKTKHEIGSRDCGIEEAHKARRVPKTDFGLAESGYERWEAAHRGDSDRVYVHRLLAVAKFGFDTVCDNQVHHKSGVGWDNRFSNIEVLPQTDHAKMHDEERNRNKKGQYA